MNPENLWLALIIILIVCVALLVISAKLTARNRAANLAMKKRCPRCGYIRRDQ